MSTMAISSQVLDDQIMGTNSSSIVSKRSVERIYHPNEPHFFRYFVKKFQRRAPLINRGYWLRLRAIDAIVRQFITRDTPKRKVVINLGCGSDVLPWQCHARCGAALGDVLFIDVDYPDLMRKKRAIVLETRELRDLLGADFTVSESDSDYLLLRSEKYCQLACDLRQLQVFHNTLDSFLDLANCEVLFVAEVSITYMDTRSADDLIQWASSIGRAEFCLLEQILPQGPEHPFAKTMLAHFEKLNTPLKSVNQYQTVKAQMSRFKSRGWIGVRIWDLWQAWEGDEFVSKCEKRALDNVEPFDEWEEFVLFCRHYFILHASALDTNDSSSDGTTAVHLRNECNFESRIEIRIQSLSKPLKRRMANAMTIANPLGQSHLLHMMGLDINGRAATCDVFSLIADGLAPMLPSEGPPPRMCFTLTDLGNLGVMLTAGRKSPAAPLSDCWLFERGLINRWVPLPTLPVPLYRHSAVRLGHSSLVLIAGGKTGPSTVSGDLFLFHPITGWHKCQISGSIPEPSFGSIICNSSLSTNEPGVFYGLLAGGLNKYGNFIKKQYLWRIDSRATPPAISFNETINGHEAALSVFGAEIVEVGSAVAVCGGVGADASFQGCSISAIKVLNDAYCVSQTNHQNINGHPIPFMVGSSATRDNEDIVIIGGGATCFSMGTFWETDISRLRLLSNTTISRFEDSSGNTLDLRVKFLETHRYLATDRDDFQNHNRSSTASISMTTIDRVKLDSAEHFQKVLQIGRPVIIEQLNLGQCLRSWTPGHIKRLVGSDKKVVIHECYEDDDKMDFISKNFSYVTDSFGSVIDRAQSGARLYLRSLSEDRPTELPAKLGQDFPSLATEFCLPPELNYVKEHEFSSVLRVSGRVNMWLHYDVMANIYTQITGSKRMILFPPSDVKHLSFEPGASSSGLDVFTALDNSPARLVGTRPHEAILGPGDVLFLPALWLHTGTPRTDMNVAVNVFFRDRDDHYYSSGRDVYGNKDLEAYERGRQAAARIGKSFQQMPQETRRFYLTRMADELIRAAEEV